MGFPQHNPLKVQIETVKQQGYDSGLTGWSISDTSHPHGFPPLGPFTETDGDGMPAGPSEADALRPKGPGDVHPVKFSPYSSDQGM